jgi:general secretion pathway protein M
MMTVWWDQLSVRDRRVLIVGVIIVVAFLTWAYLWHPLAQQRAQLNGQLDQARRDQAYFQIAQAEVERLRNAGARSRADRQGKSLLALADITARGVALDGALKRLEPIGPRSVRATFEFVPFDTLIAWVENLARDYGVQVSDFSADQVDATGLVNARVTLEDIP